MKLLRFLTSLLVCVFVWYSLSYLSFKTYVSINRNILLNRIDSISPQGSYASMSSFDDRVKSEMESIMTRYVTSKDSNEIAEEVASNLIKKIVFVEKTVNDKYIYNIAEDFRLWGIGYQERLDDGVFKSGCLYPAQIVSDHQIISNNEFRKILNEAFLQESAHFSNYIQGTINSYKYNKELERLIINSDYDLSPEIEQRNVVGQYNGPYSSKYVNTNSAKVLVVNNEETHLLTFKEFVGKDVKLYFYIPLGIICFIIFIFLMKRIENKEQSKRDSIKWFIIIVVAYLIAGAFYLNHYISIKKKTDFIQINKHKTDVRLRFPELESFAKSVIYFKELEFGYADEYFDPYNPQESIKLALSMLYDRNPDLKHKHWENLIESENRVVMPGLSVCPNDDNSLKTYYLYDRISTTLNYINKVNLYDVSTASYYLQLKNEYDSLSQNYNVLIRDFIDTNKNIMER